MIIFKAAVTSFVLKLTRNQCWQESFIHSSLFTVLENYEIPWPTKRSRYSDHTSRLKGRLSLVEVFNCGICAIEEFGLEQAIHHQRSKNMDSSDA